MEYVKFGYSHVQFSQGESYLKQDMSRQVETPERIEAILDNFGQDGWELVQIVPGPTPENLVAYFKRPRG